MIGRRTRDDFRRHAWPPLWLWLRGVLFGVIAMLAWFTGFTFIAKALLLIGVAGVLWSPVNSLCKAVAAAIERLWK